MKNKPLKNSVVAETANGHRTFNPKNRKAWRTWLAKNHHKSQDPVYLAIYHKNSRTPNLTYGEAVEEALCFGWIDHHAMKRDSESMYLKFSPRKENGNWSKLNRDRAERMIEEGLMTDAGMKFIDIAKESGKWEQALTFDSMPADLEKAFNKKKMAKKNFEAFAPSAKRLIIQWILSGKREETRKCRIEKTVALAEKNLKSFGAN